jgi:dephospho-CoA kinase
MSKPLRVGLTGNMGAGKTLVAQVFETLRVPVFYADEEANQLAENNHQVVSEIKKLFGRDAYVGNKYNRKYVANQIFTNPLLLERLNDIIHPATFKRFDEWLNENLTAPYILKEAAILFESGANNNVDKVIFVSAPEEVRIERVQKRNPAWSGTDIKRRMKAQEPEISKISKSDYIIKNDGTTFLLPQILDVHKSLLDIAGKRLGEKP